MSLEANATANYSCPVGCFLNPSEAFSRTCIAVSLTVGIWSDETRHSVLVRYTNTLLEHISAQSQTHCTSQMYINRVTCKGLIQAKYENINFSKAINKGVNVL